VTGVDPRSGEAQDASEFDERGGALYTERTDLAWSRSGLALVGVFALLARRVVTSGAQPGDLVVVVLLGLAALGWAIGLLGWQHWHRGREVARPRDARELFAVAAGTVALAGAGLAFTFVNA
jgi:uncharacterized membrane protein YidH (DUF202 family)